MDIQIVVRLCGIEEIIKKIKIALDFYKKRDRIRSQGR